MVLLILSGFAGLMLGLIGGFKSWGLILAFALTPLVMFIAGVGGVFAYYFAIVLGAFIGQAMLKIIP
jgi:hypothetical protein